MIEKIRKLLKESNYVNAIINIQDIKYNPDDNRVVDSFTLTIKASKNT